MHTDQGKERRRARKREGELEREKEVWKEIGKGSRSEL